MWENNQNSYIQESTTKYNNGRLQIHNNIKIQLNSEYKAYMYRYLNFINNLEKKKKVRDGT